MKQLRITMIAILFFAIYPNKSYALSCAELEEPAIHHYDLAVVGTVLDVKNDLTQRGLTGAKEMNTYVLLDVEQSWKKELDSQIIIEADFTWGHPFEEGRDYLLYLNKKDGEYFNSPCSLVSEVHSRNDYVPLLGEGKAPIKEVDVSHKMWFMTDKDFDLIVVLLIGGALFIWLGRRYLTRRN